MHLSIDIETYSSKDLSDCGVWAYSEAEDFEVLLLAFSYNFSEDVQIVDLTKDPMPESLIKDLQDPKIIKHAYNAPFEITCLNHAGYKTPASQWRDTMFQALYFGLPAGLGATGEALGMPEDKQKDTAGKALIRYFCRPCEPKKSNGFRTRNLPKHDPEKWKLFKSYCCQDVVAEMEIHNRLSLYYMPLMEEDLWQLEQEYHARGIPIDKDFVDGALAIREMYDTKIMARAKEITKLKNPKSRAQAQKWVEDTLGRKLSNFQKPTVEKLVNDNENEQVTEFLKLYQDLSKTSVAKYEAIKNATGKDGRVHGAHQIYGANRTGRWAGRLIQPQNLPRTNLANLGHARELVKAKDIEGLAKEYGPNVTDTLSQLIRTAIVPSKGNQIISADFSAIEARVLAWLAGERWVMDVFATTGKIYEATASQMFGIDQDLIVKGKPEYAYRQKGKVATLALGYQGSIGALKKSGALDQGLTEEELPEIVRKWRKANPNIVNLWELYEMAANGAIKTGKAQQVGLVTFGRFTDPIYGLQWLTIQLPSGRRLYYKDPEASPNVMGKGSIRYKEALSKGMEQTDTYGGKIAENVTQAVARDCLADTMLRMQKMGWNIISHIHDEVVIDAPPDLSLEEVCELMAEPIPWAPGLLLKGAGYKADFFKKD